MPSFAQGQLKSLMDRVLRLKAEQDALTSDIKEVYAEAKSHGYDKTVMGLAVARIRKLEKNGAGACDETDAMLAIYLDAYRGVEPEASGTVVALAHGREARAGVA